MNRRASGFTLVELLLTMTILAVVVTALTVVMIGSQRSKASTEAMVESQQSARTVLDIIARDVRSAGFMSDEDSSPPQPAFAYVDSSELIIYANLQPATLGSSADPDPTQPPLAPDPNGYPLPAPIVSTYVPPVKYGTGAEMIRYTFDINNDGVISANDQDHVVAGDARRSANPDDFLLARMVYGDSSGSTPTAGNNGGAIERIGLLRGPGSGVPNLFTVYLGSNPTPWNWGNGPIPADRLDDISRVVINVTTESRRPNNQGVYARSTLTSEVNSLRNVPDAGTTYYTMDGYVFADQNGNGTKEPSDPGIANVVVRLGSVQIDRTDGNGYYYMQAPPGDFTLVQEVPAGFGPFTPDSVQIDFISSPIDHSHDFADTAMAGGWIIDTTWVDTDTDGSRDPGEPYQDGVVITVGSQSDYTNGAGHAQFFVPPGSWTVSAMPPESLVVSSTNPVSVTMNDGDTLHVDFALNKSGVGTISGFVYTDENRNRILDAGEPGIGSVWVGVMTGTAEVLAFGYSDPSGYYEVDVPNNMPAAVNPYIIMIQVPAGLYPTTPAAIMPFWIEDAEIITDQNFGLQGFQLITLNAERVLSLGAAELMEKDWSGSDTHTQYSTKGHQDPDLILGSEFSANPNISIWFNNWDSTPIYDLDPDYQRNAWASALSMSVGPLDNDAPWDRPDVVTGLETYISGNIAVWLTQNSDGNFGYMPTTPNYYQTLDGGNVNDVALLDVDGDSDLDLIAATKSYANAGSFEIWLNDGDGAFTREVGFPPYGGLSTLGEVQALELGDIDKDGDLDIAMATKVGDFDGTLVLMEKTGTTSPYFTVRTKLSLAGKGTAAAVMDANGDGWNDAVIASQVSGTQGVMQLWVRDSSPWDFKMVQQVDAPGIVLALEAEDLGGLTPRTDLAVGFRVDEVNYAGGIRLYYMDGASISPTGTDPSAGLINFMVPAIQAGNFNFGANPAPTGTALEDVAVAVKSGPTTGAVVLFIR